MRKLGPYSNRDAFRNLDGRTWEAKLLRDTRAELTAHVGGTPSATQRALIERAAWLALYVAIMDKRSADLGAMTAHDSNQYLAWTNSLARIMSRIGPQAKANKPDLSNYLASRTIEAAA